MRRRTQLVPFHCHEVQVPAILAQPQRLLYSNSYRAPRFPCYATRIDHHDGSEAAVRVVLIVVAVILLIWLLGALIGLVGRALQVVLIVVVLLLIGRALMGDRRD